MARNRNTKIRLIVNVDVSRLEGDCKLHPGVEKNSAELPHDTIVSSSSTNINDDDDDDDNNNDDNDDDGWRW